MAQDFTLGRCGLPTSAGGDGLELKVAESGISQEGDSVSVSGVIRGQTSVGDLNALRAQLAGYHLNPDERVVPVTSVADTSIDGFYRVNKVEVGAEATGRALTAAQVKALAVRWEAELVKVPGWQAPLFEDLCSGALRVNAHSITDSGVRSWVGMPPAADLLHGYNFTGAGVAAVSDAGESHTNLLLYDDEGVPNGFLYDRAALFATAPSDFYNAAAKLETSADGGSTWRSVVGRQVANLPEDWRIGNDLIRITHSSANVFTFSGYLSGWENKNFKVTYAGASATSLGTPKSLTVLRNTPETVSVRVWMSAQLTTDSVAYVDFTVHRSAWWLTGLLAHTSNTNTTFGIYRDAVEAATSVTGGIDATSADASGNKYQFRTPLTVTKDTTNGGIHHAGTTYLPFCVALDTMQDGTLTTSAAYFVTMNHRQGIVAR